MPAQWQRNGAWQDEWAQWHCGNCQTANWANYGSQRRRCRHCGVNKTYLDAVLTRRAPRVAAVAAPPGPAAGDGIEQLDRKSLVGEIRVLESSLSSLPADPTLDQVNKLLEDKVAAKKLALRQTRPLAAQLDAARSYAAR